MLYGELDVAVLLTAVAFLAGYVDAVAGGGGLLTVPALLLAGLSPVEAVATNKLQGTFGVAASSYVFWRAGYVDFPLLRPAIGAAAIGALGGSFVISNADPTWMKVVAPGLLVAIAIYFAFAPGLNLSPARSGLRPIAIAAAIAFPVGFYDGLLGPGAGSFYLAGLVLFAGSAVLPATAGTKVLNFTSNVVALFVFLTGGNIVFALGLPMAVAQIAGAQLGARCSIRYGAALIRPMIVIISLLMAFRLLVT